MAITTTTTVTHWGAYLVESDGHRVTAVRGHPLDPDPSPIGECLRAVDRCRVARPAVRRSWLEDGASSRSGAGRGREPFVEVEWDEALDLVAGELARVRDRHGHSAVYGGSYGWSSAGRFHMAMSQTARFLRLFGGYTDRRGTYSGAAAETIIPRVLGLHYGDAIGQQTSWSVIARHTDLVVSFGGLRLSNAQVTFGGQGPHGTRDWLLACRAGGVRFVSVSPLRDDQIAEVDGRWVPTRPGTDVAVMAGLIHALVTEGLAAEAFLDRYCTGWPAVRDHILREGQTPAWAEEIAGLPADTLGPLAREMAGGRTLVNVSLSVQRGDHGEQPYWMAIALAAALGQIGLPGGGFGFTYGSQGNVGAGQVRKPLPGLPVPPPPPGMPVIPVSRVTEMLEGPGREYDHDGRRRTYPDIRLVYWCGGNPFHHHQDLNRLGRAWERPETIVVHEPFWTATAKRADIVLPSTTPLERDDLGAAETLLIAMKAAIEPYGEARDDYAIYAGLADRLGFGEEFTQGRSVEDWLRHLYAGFAAANAYAPPFDDFWADGTLVHDMPRMGEPEAVFLAAFRAAPDEVPLPTPSGRIELCSSTIAGFGYDDCPPHPVWLEPYERLGTPAAERHPLHLVSNQPTVRLHSQYDHSDASLATKVAGREPLRMHPDDAAARGIAPGDLVRVFNDRGACLAGAVVSEAMMPGVVQISTGAWYDPDEDGMCRHGNPNVLTRDKGTSRLAQGPTAHTCLVDVELFDGPPPLVRAFDPPDLIAPNEA